MRGVRMRLMSRRLSQILLCVSFQELEALNPRFVLGLDRGVDGAALLKDVRIERLASPCGAMLARARSGCRAVIRTCECTLLRFFFVSLRLCFVRVNCRMTTGRGRPQSVASPRFDGLLSSNEARCFMLLLLRGLPESASRRSTDSVCVICRTDAGRQAAVCGHAGHPQHRGHAALHPPEEPHRAGLVFASFHGPVTIASCACCSLAGTPVDVSFPPLDSLLPTEACARCGASPYALSQSQHTAGGRERAAESDGHAASRASGQS